MEARGIKLAVLIGISITVRTIPVHSQDRDIDVSEAYLSRPFISSIEIFGGVGHSYYRGDDFSTDQVRNLSITGGIGVTHFLSDRLEVNARVLVERKGFKKDFVQTFFDSDNNSTTTRFIQGLKLDYYTLQVIPMVHFGKENHFFVGLGGYVALIKKASNYTEQYSLSGPQISSFYSNALSDFRKLDSGLSSTLGYQNRIRSNIDFTCQLLFNLGLMDIRSPTQSAFPFRNNFISILLGLKLKSQKP